MTLKSRVKRLEADVAGLFEKSKVSTYEFCEVDLGWCANRIADLTTGRGAHIADRYPGLAGAKAALAQAERDSIRSTLKAHLELMVEKSKSALDGYELAELSKPIVEAARILLEIK